MSVQLASLLLNTRREKYVIVFGSIDAMLACMSVITGFVRMVLDIASLRLLLLLLLLLLFIVLSLRS